MRPSDDLLDIRWIDKMDEVAETAWDRLADPTGMPFLQWRWLRLLESSGSVGAAVGWKPRYLTLYQGGQLLAAAPLYLKSHSAGEFVFDAPWAEVAQRLGIRYYPKLVGMSPFSPVTGYRFLIAPRVDPDRICTAMVKAIDRYCLARGIASANLLFIDAQWRRRLAPLGFNAWQHQSFLWENQSFTSFDNYLSLFNTNQRRNIKRERRSLQQAGITIRSFEAEAIPDGFFPLLYALYAHTNDRYGPWGCKYLTPAFFEGLAGALRRHLVVMAGFRGEEAGLPLGMSLLVRKEDRLFGRYWGRAVAIKDLHFNLCYYAPIEYAIAKGIRRFDPGAGGEHKIRRGFQAVANFSLHKYYHPAMQALMRRHIGEINRLEQQQIDAINASVPFHHFSG